jgi:hypothetical protein
LPSAADVVISTWYVSDGEEEATYFPQIGLKSNAPDAKAVYWRCVLCFFASSIAVNPQASHVFFTNSELPVIDGLDVAFAFKQWNVRTVNLAIQHRLPVGQVGEFGNQFYIFDILCHIARFEQDGCYIVLDSDCVWIQPVSAISEAAKRYGVLTYLLDESIYSPTQPINGLTRQGMARFLKSISNGAQDTVPYCGGEIFAATHTEISRLAKQIGPIWRKVVATNADSPKEEAHLLSILYAINGYEIGTANAFIKRMWTTFKHNNLDPSDADLAIWHLPSEKKTGFRELFLKLVAGKENLRNPAILGFSKKFYGRAMGVPRRSLAKFVRDLTAKLSERLIRLLRPR